MNADQLRALQAPLKDQYRQHPASAMLTLKAVGDLAGPDVGCVVHTARGDRPAGLHPATGGDGSALCAGDMLLEALAGCAGTTLKAVATAMGIAIRAGTIRVEGDMDFRGTLGVSKEVPVGFQKIRLTIELDSDATPEQLAKLVQLTERYCVIFQTLKNPPEMVTSLR